MTGRDRVALALAVGVGAFLTFSAAGLAVKLSRGGGAVPAVGEFLAAVIGATVGALSVYLGSRD